MQIYIGYYRKFKQAYGCSAEPVTSMLKKDLFSWTSNLVSSFNKLKEADGPILMQQGRPIAYFIKALHGRNQLQSTYGKELLVLVSSAKKWKQYLVGGSFVIKTDHSA